MREPAALHFAASRVRTIAPVQGQQWRTVGTWEGDAKVRAVPFDAIELDLSSLWADIRRRPQP